MYTHVMVYLYLVGTMEQTSNSSTEAPRTSPALTLYYNTFNHWRSYMWGVAYSAQLSVGIVTSSMLYLGLKGHEGASSIAIKAPRIMFAINAGLGFLLWMVFEIEIGRSGRREWWCDSKDKALLNTIWNLFVTFGLCVMVPTFLNYIAFRKLPGVSKNWIHLSASSFIGALYYYIFSQGPINVITIYFRLKSDWYKALFRLCVLPVINFLIYKLAVWNAKKLKLKDQTDDIYPTLFLRKGSI